MYKGSCLCGKVQFTITGPVDDIVYCHCSQCRKAQGSAFATNANVAAHDFTFLSGEDNLSAYQYSEHQKKYFCRSCGSPIMSKNETRPEVIRIRLGTLESDITERPQAHIFVSSKANWEKITDDIPQYEEYILSSQKE